MKQQWAMGSLMVILASGCSSEQLMVDDEPDAVGLGGGGSEAETGGGNACEPVPPPRNGPILPVSVDSPEDCPATTPEGVCAHEGLLCAYRGECEGGGCFDAYGCFAAGSTELWWTHYMGGATLWPDPCPLTKPETTESCFGLGGALCNYLPRDECMCAPGSDDPKWECTSLLDLEDRVEFPEELDVTTPINELSDAQRETWCRWYVDESSGGVGRLEPSVGPVDENGYVTNTGCNYGWDLYNCALRPHLPTVYCEQNLALSSCELPLAELTDCVRSVIHGFPSPTGCGRYLEPDSCAGTIVARNPGTEVSMTDPTTYGCAIRVE